MHMTYATIVRRALAAGAAIGVILAGYMFFVVEPVIDDAIELEEQLAHADEPSHGEEAARSHGDGDALFSRAEQVGGGLAANVAYALIAAGIFGTLFAALRHRLPGSTDLARAAWLAAVAFGTIALVPALKYPANPPAVGDPDTVGERTVQYLVLIALSILVAAVLTRLAGELADRLPNSTRWATVAAATVTAYGALLVIMPGTSDAIAPEVPAGLVWDFRVRSLGGLALLWAGLGVGLGWLLARDTPARRSQVAGRDLVRS